MKVGEVEKEIIKLGKTKATQKADIPTRIIKENIDTFAEILCTNINSAIKSSSFSSSLKLADVTPMHKKGRKNIKENFMAVSILPTLSTFFAKCMFTQMSNFVNNIFSNQQFGFRKGYIIKRCLLVMLEAWKRSVDKSKVFRVLLTDLSKAFDCLDHELITAKLNAYGFSTPTLRLISDYLSNRKQRTKIENTYSTWLGIIFKSSTRFNTRTIAT